MPAAVELRNGYKNRILASLPKAEIARLASHLSPLNLPSGKTLLDPGQDIGYGYFLETGLASVVVAMQDGNMVETGITGNEGLVGIPVLLGTKSMPTRTFMQIPGDGFKIKANRLNEEYERSGTLRKLINRYFQAHLVQTAQTAACNRLHDIAERLARWLLMCHDRMDANTFTITHEFLGHMLGTPRSTVTLAAGILNKSGLIQYSRGKVSVQDRKGLEKAACECYQTIRTEFDRLGISSV
ncbi:MAG TPA: Crp/Fnr family transcriptional regulator [Candidatus Angelobacter sp.]|jgi:CRP-like cAMP-binding protein